MAPVGNNYDLILAHPQIAYLSAKALCETLIYGFWFYLYVAGISEVHIEVRIPEDEEIKVRTITKQQRDAPTGVCRSSRVGPSPVLVR